MSQTTNVPIILLESGSEEGLFVHGEHVPAPLVEKSGVWIDCAGSAMLSEGAFELKATPKWLWMAADAGEMHVSCQEKSFPLQEGECLILPPDTEGCRLSGEGDTRLLWFSLDGPLASDFLKSMNALSDMPAKQGMLPAQLTLLREIVQVLVRHSGTSNASYQLQQLMWSMIAAHAGQPVAKSAMLSHEIARVVDTLRANQYRDNFSLAEMAAISRVPVETFRKRFVSEVGIPPLGYLQFCKMERAKTLLREGLSVRQAGVAVGMKDPYHFSKQFKHVVGMSPTAYLKHVGGEAKGKRRGVRAAQAAKQLEIEARERAERGLPPDADLARKK